MAIEFAVQRLGIGDVVLVGLPGQDEKVEATVVRDIDRTETTVRATLRVEGRQDFVEECLLASWSQSCAVLETPNERGTNDREIPR